jgi:hypothetical protein
MLTSLGGNEMNADYTATDLKLYAKGLGYMLSDDDCKDIIETSFKGETVEEAVNDYLNAYER